MRTDARDQGRRVEEDVGAEVDDAGSRRCEDDWAESSVVSRASAMAATPVIAPVSARAGVSTAHLM